MIFYAGGFIYNSKSKEVLLHLRDTRTKNNPNLWAFFGGLSELDETPEETFKREAFEELNISVGSNIVNQTPQILPITIHPESLYRKPADNQQKQGK